MSATKFIEKMGDDADFRQTIGVQLMELAEGDWNGVASIGKAAGFDFTKSELIAALPKGFFKGNGQNPEFGWDASTIED